MNNPTKLLHTDIIAVEVPRETIKCVIVSNHSKTESLYIKAYASESVYRFIPIEEKGVFELLGEATETEISFDVEPYVDFIITDAGKQIYRNYNEKQALFYKESMTIKESFYSLLQASGLK